MSQHAARQALSRMNLREVAIAAHYTGMERDMIDMAAADPTVEHAKFMERRGELCEAFGFRATTQEKPFAFAYGIAVIPVTGMLINRFGGAYSFATGYNFIRRQLALAMADDDVKGIIFDVNSYGGEAAGCFELSEDIYAARSIKPSIAMVDSNAYSAGYAIASAAGKVVLTPSGGTGSIGVVAMHMDVSKALADNGIKITFIQFGAHKTDGNPYEPLSKEVLANLQASINVSGEMFVNLVARNRGIEASVVKGTEARTYRAEDAKSLGLIDTVATPSQAMQVLFDELSGSISTTAKGTEMSQANAEQPGATTTTAATTAAPAVTTPAVAAAPAAAAGPTAEQAATDARVAERARVKGITGCEEAKGKSNLANHLAMDTELSVDAAKAILKASAPEAAAAATTTGAGFAAAMSGTANPNVGATADAGNAAGGGETAAQQILRDQASATGVKLVAVK